MAIEPGIHRVQKSNCPYCGNKLDAVGNPSDPNIRAPRPGDVNVCIRCAGLMRFTEDMQLRKLTEADIAEFMSDDGMEEVLEMQQRIARFIASRG